MRRFWIVLITMLIVSAGVAGPRVVNVSASGHGHALAAKKKCKKAYHRVHGKCKKKHALAPTPTPSPTAVPGVIQYPNMLAVDPQGNIYVTEGDIENEANAGSRVIKLSPTGQLLASWGTDGSAPGQFNIPFAIALDAQGNIYVADFLNDRIQKLSPTGQVLSVWESIDSGPGQLVGQGVGPVGIALDAQGNAYVTVYGDRFGQVLDSRIKKFSPTGHELAVWGSTGSEPGEFRGPAGIALDTHGNLYVVDQHNARIQKLSPTGQLLATWGTAGSAQGQFDRPLGIALDPQGNIYVADRAANRIQKFSSTGDVLAVWGPGPPYDFSGSTPFGVATDVQGNVYVADRENSRILKLSPTGQVLAIFR